MIRSQLRGVVVLGGSRVSQLGGDQGLGSLDPSQDPSEHADCDCMAVECLPRAPRWAFRRVEWFARAWDSATVQGDGRSPCPE